MPTMDPERDIVQPIASEEARAAYLEEHMKNMGGVQLPSSIPSQDGRIKHISRISKED